MQVSCAELQISARVEQHRGIKAFQPDFSGKVLPHFGQKLHETDGLSMGDGVGIELRLLPDHRCHQKWIQAILTGVTLSVAQEGPRNKIFPELARKIARIKRIVTG